MDQRISLVTLGTADLPRAVVFYEALGWKASAVHDDVAFFQTGCMAFALWERSAMAVDAGLEDGGGFGGIELAQNVGSPQAVDAIMAAAERAGARVQRPGAASDWGGYSGLFLDPDGHPWEIAHNPAWTLNDDGSITLP